MLIDKVKIPEGKSGDWVVQHFTIEKDKAELENMLMLFGGYGHRRVRPGKYTRLGRGNTIVMSDTDAEMRGHYAPVEQAEERGGTILINGLGLGMVATAILKHKNVKRVIVIEQSPDVIKLVAPTLLKRFGDRRLNIIEADSYEYKPPKGERYTVAWHDIWDEITDENLPEMAKLHRKYGRRCDWQGSWEKEWLVRERRRDAAYRGW